MRKSFEASVAWLADYAKRVPQRGADNAEPVKLTKSGPVPNKVGAIVTNIGEMRFDSKKEARIWQGMWLRFCAGELDVLQRQVTFVFTVQGKRVGHYRADIVYRIKGEPQLRVLDVKGRHPQALRGWARTKALMLACYAIDVEEA